MLDLTPTTARVASLVDGVREEHLAAPTPSEGTSVQMVVQHLLGLSVAFRDAAAKVQGPTTRTPPAPVTEPLPDGWREQLVARLDELAAAWRDDDAWDGTTTAGGVTFPAEACGLVALDEVLLHGWELAVSTGQPYEPTDGEAEAVLPIVSPSGDAEADAAMRDGVFGPALPVPDGATPFERALLLSGRDPGWCPA
ncbi:TIGR03086 family metal-binding protein [Angustibacter speluncae]